MGFIIILSISLAMDAFAVSVSLNLSKMARNKADKIKVASSFGIFQGIMPLIGYFVVAPFSDQFRPVIDRISFLLLLFLGVKAVVSALKNKENPCGHPECSEDLCLHDEDAKPAEKRLSNKDLLVYSLATSIDALMAGIFIQTQQAPVIASGLVIGIVTFTLSYLGLNIKVKNKKIEDYSEVLGGVILILLAIKVALSF